MTASTTTATLTLSNFTYTEIIEGPANITYNSYGSSVTVGGTAVANGGTSATITENGAELVATPVSGATFVAWINKDTNEILSQEATATLKPYATSMNIEAVFTKATETPYYKVGTTLYTDLSEAITAAQSGSSKSVVVISDGTMPVNKTFNIPSGVSLLVPYSTSDLDIDSDTVIDESGNQGGTLVNANMKLATLDSEGLDTGAVTAVLEPDTSVTYTLTVPASTTINVQSGGKLIVGGVLVAGTNSTTGICGATGGAHANIELEGTINVASGGVLSACGYIKGSGTVNVASSGTVYQPYILMDHKDGHYLYAAKEESRFPVYRYAIMNIQSDLVMNSGADMYGYAVVFTKKNSFAEARFNPTVAHVIGSGEDSALFLLNSGTLTMSYDSTKTVSVTSSTTNNTKGYYNKIGRTTMSFAGNAGLGSITLSVVVVGSNYDMTSADSEYPIPYNFDLVQQSGTFSVSNNMALLPGATFTVNKDAAMEVASGKSLVIYDGLRDYAVRAESVTLDSDAENETGGAWPLYHYPTSANLKAGGFSSTAELIVNGTLTVNGNLGGTVQTTGTTGSIIMASDATASATGTFGMQNETVDIKVDLIVTTIGMTIGGSCGKTVRTLPAQVFRTGDTGALTLEAGKNYYAVGTDSHELTDYTYSVYASHEGDATTESKSDLDATLTGSWCVYDFGDVSYKWTGYTACTASHTCAGCGYVETASATITNAVTTAATCEGTGVRTYTAAFGASWAVSQTATETIAALGHTWDDGKITTAPTCAHTGVKTFTCGTCAGTKTETVAQLPHSDADNDGDHKCDSCEDTLTTCVDENKDHICDECGATRGTHADSDKDHVCDYGCSVSIGECSDGDDADHKCDYGCGTELSECADADSDHDCDVCGTELTQCADADNDHDCDVCDTKLSECADADSDHDCDVCGTELTQCADADSDHDCDVCGTELTQCADADNDHNCDVCDTKLSDCADADNDHDCDVCDTKLSDCADADSDHDCDVCDTKLSECADADSDHDCDVCGTELTQCADADSDHDCDVCGTELTQCADADNDHNCDVCGTKLSDCADADNDHDCDVCGTKLSDCADADNDHDCDVCGAEMGTHAAAEGKHTCDYCGETVSSHNYNAVVTAPTCTADGYTTYTCSVCGDHYTEEGDPATGEHTDSDNDGSCDNCGTTVEVEEEELVDENLKFYNKALNLKSYIGASFIVLEEIRTSGGYEKLYIEVTHNDNTKTIYGADPVDGMIGFEYAMYAAQMTDVITVTLYGVKDGKVYTGETVEGWSIRSKCIEMLNTYYPYYTNSNPGYKQRCDIAATMLAYGAQAQLTFDYNVDDLATSGLKEDYLNLVRTDVLELEAWPTFDESGKQVTLYNPALLLQENIKIQLIFGMQDTDISAYHAKVTCNGETTEIPMTVYPGYAKYAYMEFDGQYASDLREDISVTIYKGDVAVSADYTFSVENLAAKMQSSRGDLVNAMMHYSDAAKALFG